MAVLREQGAAESFPDAGPDAAQRDRALASLLADGLVEQHDGGYRLPR
jgi:A/G-specific adenine glycosylase